MKKSKPIQIGSTTYELYFTIADLRYIEQELGKSLISIVLQGQYTPTQITIDFLMAVLRYGLHDGDKRRTDEELYELLDQYCADEGHNLDRLGYELLMALYETGFFIPGTAAKTVVSGTKSPLPA